MSNEFLPDRGIAFNGDAGGHGRPQRKKRSEAGSGKVGRPSRQEFLNHYVDVMTDKGAAAALPEFGRVFHVMEQRPGEKQLLMEIGEGVVRSVGLDAVTDAVLSYSRNHLALIDAAYLLTHRDAEQVARIFRSVATPLSQSEWPAAIRQRSECGLTYHRLSFDFEPCTDLSEIPAFAEIASRTSNFPAMAMRIASIFDPLADRKQTVYLYGPKDCGKSQIVRIIAHLMGAEASQQGAFATLGNHDLQSPHYKHGLVGKRMLVVNEATVNFLLREEFKALTGDRYHKINPKGQPMYEAILEPLIFFVSNDPPAITHEPALIERIIACRMEPVQGGKAALAAEEQYQARLRNELPKFLGYAAHLYEPFKGGNRIPCGTEDLMDAIDLAEAEAIDLFHQLFVEAKDRVMPRLQVQQVIKTQAPNLSGKAYSAILQVWERRFGIRRSRPTCTLKDGEGTRRVNMLVGLRPLTPQERPYVLPRDY